jgi:shikimate kinase
MPRVAEAISHGAVTIVNAMATGKGAALGVKLWTEARVKLTDNAGLFSGQNLSDPREDRTLMETVTRNVFHRFGADRCFGATIETCSNIPVAVGLKSSSAASNAVALASLKVLGKNLQDLEVVRLGVKASVKAGVTITGAYDDACACYFGGICITNNRYLILKRRKPQGSFRVLIHVPNKKMYTKNIDAKKFHAIRPYVEAAYRETLRGNHWTALTLNGLFYSSVLGYDSSPTKEALEAGSIAAGISGKGPATVAIVPPARVDAVISSWDRYSGRVIDTAENSRKARVLRMVS